MSNSGLTIYLLILVAAFMGIVIWVLGRKRKARFKANVRISLDAPAKALRPPKNMREEPP